MAGAQNEGPEHDGPGLMDGGDAQRRGEGLYDKMHGIGAHEVIIETPNHNSTLATLPASRVEDVVDRTGTKSMTLAPSADLRFIPRVSADEKLELLGKLRARMRKSAGRSSAKGGAR